MSFVALRAGRRLASPGSTEEGFWLGAHEGRDRRLELRWLPPIPLNLDEGDVPELATLRNVVPKVNAE